MADYDYRCPVCDCTVKKGNTSCGVCDTPEVIAGYQIEARRTAFFAEKRANFSSKYSCPKCGHQVYEHGELRGASGSAMAAFDISNKAFVYVSCKGCGYTEFYKKGVAGADMLFDFLIG